MALFLVIGLMVTLFAGCNQQSNTEPATSPSAHYTAIEYFPYIYFNQN